MEKNYLEEVQKLVDEKLSKQTKKERLGLLRAEMKKSMPNIKTIENLIKFGVGKNVEISKILKEIEEKRKKSIPNIEDKFKEYVSQIYPDKQGKVSEDIIWKLKAFFESKEIKLDVNTYTKRGLSLIHIAVAMGDVELTQMLIDRGINLNSEGETGNWRPPVEWVSSLKESEDVRKLIKKHLKPHS